LVTSRKSPTWQSSVASWLVSALSNGVETGVQKVWTLETLAREAESALGIRKSKRSWERFLASLEFLDVCIEVKELSDASGIAANALVIGQIVERARSSRKPIFFLASHTINEINVVVVSTPKGGKRWIGLPKTIDDPSLYLGQMSRLLAASSIIIPCGHAVSLLKVIRNRIRNDVPESDRMRNIDWFLSLIAFHEAHQDNKRPKIARARKNSDETLLKVTRDRSPKAMRENRNIEMNSKGVVAGGSTRALTHLDRLEAESIHIMREVMAHAENPVMLYSIGKDSSVMLHLARKAFYPSIPPFPLLHVDTRWKFRAMYEFREKMAKESGMELLVHINPEGVKKNINPFDHGSALHTDIMKTEGLKQALDEHRFDVAFGGARRDEEKSRAKERIFSFRNQAHRWDPKNQRPELWNVYNCRKNPGESVRVFPLSNWTELDIWQYIYRESIPIVPLYFAAERPVVERDGMLIMVDDDRMQLLPGEKITPKTVRFRTLGCYPLTGAIESNAGDLADIVLELLQSTTSERQGRAIDTDSSGSMEKKKQEGYF